MPNGTVKFFNEAKGFGFIAPDDGGADVFVHISALERSGLSALNEGDIVAFELEQDRRSGKPAAVDLQVVGSSPVAARPARPRFGGAERPAYRDSGPRSGGFGGAGGGGGASRREPSGSGSGVVKWFNTVKGFGFIQPSDGGSDVFVHISAVERAGMSSLVEGQKVSYDVVSERGKLAASNLQRA